MPTYSYRCTECETAFDIHQAFTESSLTECPTCSGKLRKVFSSIGVTFNGSGFYRNDSRKSPGSGDTGSSAPAKDSTAAPKGSDKGSGSASGSGSKPESGSASGSGSAKPAPVKASSGAPSSSAT
ncbi:MAG: FmdB family transcriptional regulator [Cryobacterium sp.]|nr:FmdB family transcriptional regulator [Cryobacterium sp.]